MDVSQFAQPESIFDPAGGGGEGRVHKLPRLARVAIIATLAALSWVVVVAPYAL